MRLILAAILFASQLLATTPAEAYKKGSPFKSEVDNRFDDIESMTGDITYTQTGTAYGVSVVGAGKVTQAMQFPQTADGLHSKRLARASWNFATSGGAVSAIPSGVILPAKAIINRSWIHVTTQIVGATSTMAISCEDANNIKTATDLTGTAANGFIEGAQTGAASAMTASIAAACNITFTIGTAAATAGHITVFVEYVVSQ